MPTLDDKGYPADFAWSGIQRTTYPGPLKPPSAKEMQDRIDKLNKWRSENR